MHHDGGIQADDVFMILDHGSPPVRLDVVFKFYAIWSVIIDTAKSIIDFAGRENETVFFTMGY
jgi:hypothetical protein